MRIRKWFGVPVAIALLAGLMLTVGVSAQDEGQPSFPINITFLNAMTAQQEIDVFVNGSDKDQRVVEGLKYGEFSDVFEGSSPVTNIIIKRNVNLGFDQWLFNTVVPTEAG